MTTDFEQTPPTLGNQYADDRVLRSYLARLMPDEAYADVHEELRVMGDLAGNDLYDLHLADLANEPTLTRWDAWGHRIDHIEPTTVWKMAERLAAEHGVVATAYEQRHGALSRVHQFALAYLFIPSTDVYGCPLAMTDGAARTLIEADNQALVDEAVTHLTCRDPERFWTSGQWMTELAGGSDVSRSRTMARRDDDGVWRLYGRKWFTSAITANMALALARPEGNEESGSGLALFYVPIRDADGVLKPGIRVNRLKDKLGTRKLPTAELQLDGAEAHPVAGTSHGTRHIVPMLNITRTWNAVTAVALMRRGLALARDYATKREAFGQAIIDQPLHQETLADLEATVEGAFHLTFRGVELLGRLEAGEADEHEANLLRLLTPIVKLLTAKQSVSVLSEVLEAFGGAGYVEDTGLPVLLRDAQVLPIWEGTTNVLSLDLLRAIRQVGGLGPIKKEFARCVEAISDPALIPVMQRAALVLRDAAQWLRDHREDKAKMQAGARRLAFALGRVMEVALTARHAQWSLQHESDRRSVAAAERLALTLSTTISGMDTASTRALAYNAPYPHAASGDEAASGDKAASDDHSSSEGDPDGSREPVADSDEATPPDASSPGEAGWDRTDSYETPVTHS